MKLLKKTAVGQRRVYDIEVEDVHNFYANGVNVHNCATNGGVSVIRDDGTVVDIEKTFGGNTWNVVSFTSQNQLKMHSNVISVTWLLDIPSADIGSTTSGGPAGASSFTATNLTVSGSKFPRYLGYSSNGSSLPNNWGSSSGLTSHSRNAADEDLGMVAYTTSSYATGWMPGDIKLAALANSATADRSVNNNPLTQNGTITAAPVATGADVVAYSGFSSTNYLEQPYNPDLDFGTGDFCVMGWFKGTASDGILIMRDSAPTAENFFVRLLSGEVQCRIDDDTTSKVFTGGSGLNNGAWHFVVLVKSGNDGLIYVNGSLEHTEDISTVGNLDNANAILTIGNNVGLTNDWDGSLALIRISATAPSADQIAKIYEDEKVLFQENAKATLTGSSDAVTALAHDPDTNLMHVGTSGGRSVFQGLRRVEEHTGTNSQSLAAISAVDGLVVEGK